MPSFFETILEFLYPSTLIEKRIRKMSQHHFESLSEPDFSETKKVLSFFYYGNPVIRESIRQIKYFRNQKLIKIMANVMYQGLLEELSEKMLFEGFEKPLLVPVPQTRRERSERGYNQVELLIDDMVKISEDFEKDFNILKKTKETKRQNKLKRGERLENVKGAFTASEKARGRNIILIDDVTTTGATLRECRHALRSTRARSIFCVTLAK